MTIILLIEAYADECRDGEADLIRIHQSDIMRDNAIRFQLAYPAQTGAGR
jgi:hypothetical protein